MKKFNIMEVRLDSNLKPYIKVCDVATGQNQVLNCLEVECRSPREIVCINNRYGLNAGETYHMTSLSVCDWYTLVYLQEKPNIGFNSVIFAEMPK